LYIDTNGLWAGSRAGGTTQSTRYELTMNGVSANAWHHAAATLDATSRILTLYLDGLEVAEISVPTASTGNTSPVVIGRSGPAGDYWDGELDDIRIWNVARTPAEIAANYTTAFASPPAGLVANWHFDEGTGTSATDSAGADDQNATLHGGASWAVGPIPAATALPPDNTAPTITAVQATGVTATSATIRWTTNEPASSDVDYGTTIRSSSPTTRWYSAGLLRARSITSGSRAVTALVTSAPPMTSRSPRRH
jgi:hypothetical protein